MTPTTHGNLRPVIVDPSVHRDTFKEDILEGLSRSPKKTPARHLYDARGSRLFEQICELPEYYPTRTETSIYVSHIDDIAERLGGKVTLVEPGAGSGEKAARLLEALDRPQAFVPIEISFSAVEQAVRTLAARFPDVEFDPVQADFTVPHHMPDDLSAEQRVVFFPGSTIGNLEQAERADLLRRFRSMAGPDGMILMGMDLIKDEDVMHRAYNDEAGVTGAFNLNLLHRINRELDGNFRPERFEHDAPWVAERGRIEMNLVSLEAQTVTVAGKSFRFGAGERLHTESSHKFDPGAFDREAAAVGLALVDQWTDERNWFRVALYRCVG